MFHRTIKPIKSNSYFLFGPRGTGKTTFLKEYHRDDKVLWIDLLNPSLEDEYSMAPELLTQKIEAEKNNIEWVVIDEVQKVPKLLDLVHYHIENSGIKFALTGSSARKLKRGASNLLAGRAFMNSLFPLTYIEMGEKFNLEEVLQFGALPKISQLTTEEEKQAFLKTYATTYLKEEIWAEHIIRQLDPFRKFLEIAAQGNGQIINYSNIAKDVGVDTKTVQSYFQILEDTLVGVVLESFHYSLRKRQRVNPKFYYFDIGVKRALEKTLTQKVEPKTYAFGRAFEHFIVLEAIKLNSYHNKDFSFSYLTTKDGSEIDLIIERPGMKLALVEIKSSQKVDERDTRTLENFLKDMDNAEAFCLSLDPDRKKIGNVNVLPWQEGFRELGLSSCKTPL